MAAQLTLPQLPAKHRDLPSWIQNHPDTPLNQIIAPYNDYDAVVRRLFAQERSHPALQENHLNIVPLYDARGNADVRVRARDLASEPSTIKERYIMPLKEEDRRPNGTPAVVPRLDDFWRNFNIFSEGALSDLDWSNVVVAGSAVVTCLLPVPEEHRGSKRALRKYYYEKVASASDVDLFLYGLDEAEAIEKIKQIEDKIKNSILHETTTVRTKNTITIVSQYPTRHVQIVLRIYKTIAEILTGFDVDCACAAFDGKQVFASPRALASYITQINTIDLSRRSPSYENRLSKYSHRGFEVFWPELDRSQVDPTIFEQSFTRVVGLARLLVLEKLPKSSDRESYIEQRRQERGRPAPRYNMRRYGGNIKDDWVDEVPEWEEGEEISDYNTFTIPYGPRFRARKVEKLLYAKDLLLNAEWNKPKDREVNLHRHPAFFGDVADVIQDCCGFCPQPETEEEKEIAETESKLYVSGSISFIKDDPGRQEIGSFNPITETDWTEMAYVGNTERLCRAIVDCDKEEVEACLAKGKVDPNNRDYTGRTPLHLACLASTPDIVQCLVDHGARLISRLADGRTALHLAAARGSVEIVRILLRKSAQNEAEQSQLDTHHDGKKSDKSGTEEPDSDGDQISCTSGSFIHVDGNTDPNSGGIDLAMSENEMEPDVYDINVVSWDIPTSALHLAILNGQVHVVDELVASFGADVLLPVKLVHTYGNSPRAAILNLALALRLPREKVNMMTEKLLQLGAVPTQADLHNVTPLHYVAASDYPELLEIYLNHNRPATLKAINYLVPSGSVWRTGAHSALTVALSGRNAVGATKLLEAAAQPSIDFESFVRPGQGVYERIKRNSSETNKELFRWEVTQPIILAVQKDLPMIAVQLLISDVDPNTLTPQGYNILDKASSQSYAVGQSLLDVVREKIRKLRKYHGEKLNDIPPLPLVHPDRCLNDLELGTYQMWAAEKAVRLAKMQYEKDEKKYAMAVSNNENRKGLKQKISAVHALLEEFERLEIALLQKGAKSFYDLFPEKKKRTRKDMSQPELPKAEPFGVDFKFSVPDLTDTKKKAYLELFEAAWRGDLNTIKALTLVATGDETHLSPLQVAVRDQNNFSPFSIAVLRGHQQVAKAILEIAQAQYKRKDSGTRARYEMDLEAFHEDAEIHIYSEIIDDRFTIENIGETAMQVECEISPLQLFSWNCPASMFIDEESNLADLVHYTVWKNDVDMLEFLLQLGQELTERDTMVETKIYTVSTSAFRLAIGKGHLGCLEAIIKYTGADLPIDNLLQGSGIEIKEKPRFYQGLSVRGRKRADWVAAGGGMISEREEQETPLLTAAFSGSLPSVQWFLSSAPVKNYVEFIKGHEQEDKLKLLSESINDLEGPLTGWIQSKNEFILHCTILSKPTEEPCRLVEYLVKRVPQFIETKSAAGHTPLALAFSLDRVDFAHILIKAGANQTTRDRKGNNLVHLLLSDINGSARDEPGNMERLLALLDTRLIPSLLTERSSDDPGSLTPIARWMHHSQRPWRSGTSGWGFDRHRETSGNLAVARCFLEFAQLTGQKHLDMFDGTGNTPLHEAVKQQYPRVFEAMAEYRPDLLYRENATGSTPLELAVDNWVAEALSDPPPMLGDGPQSEARNKESSCVLDRQPESFDPDYPTKPESERQAICRYARERASTNPRKRKLVSLNEANEVAKRLAVRKSGETSTKDSDVVAQWYYRAVRS
ncbi:ankyrin repeat protein [Aspergillus ibericus CBS 121593]|uniref:Ankyrin repeat protein n=1 Tax=Aspergillus ibericus CBS 121593 TaxID=1448316 RepID=A0A395H9Y7_9EURO|nr:ankyrin repeat protein [Aspergillus ibericus CBS 121593]RAL04303.1 ankyrin repeat protein [Aspergillus ibericus CBS 121593]